MTTQNQALSQFTIFRDGQPDTEYIDELIAQERRMALNEAAQMALNGTKRYFIGFVSKAAYTALQTLDSATK